MAGQDGCHSDIMTQLLCHVTSSLRDADLKGDIFRRAIYPPSLLVIAFIFSVLPPGLRRPNKARSEKCSSSTSCSRYGNKKMREMPFVGYVTLSNVSRNLQFCVATKLQDKLRLTLPIVDKFACLIFKRRTRLRSGRSKERSQFRRTMAMIQFRCPLILSTESSCCLGWSAGGRTKQRYE